jgi:hypothetical protein
MKFGLSAKTQQKVLAGYAKMVTYPIPGDNTFPSVGRKDYQRSLEEENKKYHIDFIRKYEHKKWWRQLKETLGEEYLENLRKQCYYMVAALRS